MEITYLKDYVEIMKPIADGLDYLQGDKTIFYGHLLPALFTIKTRLNELKRVKLNQEKLPISVEVISPLINAFQTRFKAELSLDESAKLAVIAAVSHPEFKLRWADSEEDATKARDIFINAVNEASSLDPDQEMQPDTSGGFLCLRPPNVQTNEAIGFLVDSRRDLKSLDSYPAVKKVFKSSNTPLCSSAAIERIFNFAGILNNPKRGSIVPDNFEICVVMKGNEIFKRNENPDVK